jgi:heme-degrading monooxygenase HmoA
VIVEDLAMSFAAVFAYEVDGASAQAFEAAYGADGEWARFFAGGEGHLGTELWRAADDSPRRYLVIDRWRSAAAYEAFLHAHEAEYRSRSEAARPLYLRETSLGQFHDSADQEPAP